MAAAAAVLALLSVSGTQAAFTEAGTGWTAASTPTFSLQTVSLIGLGLSVNCAAL